MVVNKYKKEESLDEDEDEEDTDSDEADDEEVEDEDEELEMTKPKKSFEPKKTEKTVKTYDKSPRTNLGEIRQVTQVVGFQVYAGFNDLGKEEWIPCESYALAQVLSKVLNK